LTQIGRFNATSDGFTGQLETLTLHIPLTLTPAEISATANAPDYRVIAGEGPYSVEIGAAWKRVGEKAGAFVALQIDDPSFIQPLRANLFQADARSHVLLWNRPTKRDKES
jgi:uncharacterized protein (DUF736 family)